MSRQMKDSGIPWIGAIPKTWAVIRTKNVFECSKELVGEDWKNTQLLSLSTKGIKAVEIGSTSGKVPDTYETYQKVAKDKIVMCLFDLDCSAVFSGLSPICGMISPAYKVLNVLDGYYPKFYSYWFDYIFDGRKYKYLSKNIRYSLTYDEFAALGIAAPPFEEQQRIADFLDQKCSEVDEMVALQEQIIEELKAYKQAIITEAVCKGLNPDAEMKYSGVEWLGKIPVEWGTIRIKYLLAERKERSEKGEEEPLSMSQKKGLVPTKDLETIPNNATSFVGAKLVYEGDLVFNKLKAHLGVFSVSKYCGLVSPDYAVYYSQGNVNAKYLEYLFKTDKYINEFKKLSTGVGAGLTRLYTSDLYSIYALYPSKKEQEEIVAYINTKSAEIDSLVAIKQQKIDELKEYKKSIIYEYITGKKEVAK